MLGARVRKSGIPQCGLLPTLLIGCAGWIYTECKCGRNEAIISSKLGSKLKVLRNFSIELNRFNLLTQKSERMFILTGFYKHRDEKNTKIDCFIWFFSFTVEFKWTWSLTLDCTLPTWTQLRGNLDLIFEKDLKYGRCLNTTQHKWRKPGRARTNSWADPTEIELVILSPICNTNIMSDMKCWYKKRLKRKFNFGYWEHIIWNLSK